MQIVWKYAWSSVRAWISGVSWYVLTVSLPSQMGVLQGQNLGVCSPQKPLPRDCPGRSQPPVRIRSVIQQVGHLCTGSSLSLQHCSLPFCLVNTSSGKFCLTPPEVGSDTPHLLAPMGPCVSPTQP